MPSPVFAFNAVEKAFYSRGHLVRALGGVHFTAEEHSFVTVIGPSGCGKSTLLNLAAGLDRPTRGTVEYRGAAIRAVNRDVGYVTQNDNLLPWRTVRSNVALGLELRRVPRRVREERVAELLALAGLTQFANHFPRQLSGGMRKRASLVRALAYRPESVLMDEPFGALDAQMKTVLQSELLRIWEDQGQTVLFITHDLEEAILLSDVVVVLSGSPSRVKLVERVLLPRPRNLEVDRFKPEFQKLYSLLWNSLDRELQRTAEA